MTKNRLWLANSRCSHTVISCGCHASITSAGVKNKAVVVSFSALWKKQQLALHISASFWLWQMLLNSHCCTGYGSLERKLGSPNSPPASAGGVSTASKHPENRIIYESEVQKEIFGKKLWKSDRLSVSIFFSFLLSNCWLHLQFVTLEGTYADKKTHWL